MSPLGTLALVSALALVPGLARAGCGVERGTLRLLSDDWEALHVVAERAEACAGEGVTVATERTREHKALQVPALSVTPARYTSVVVSNNTIVPLLNAGLIRPLDELVERHAPTLPERQLIRVNGKIVAIAFNANAQHLYYREDVLEEAGLEPPSSYESLLANAEALRREGRFEQPLAGTFATGWDLANEFVNLHLGLGGELFVPGSAEPAIESPAGLEALATLGELSGYMDPDFLAIDSNELQRLWESGEVAMAIGWSSRAEALTDTAGDAPEVASNTALAAAPTIGDGTVPAATLWWNGFTIASRIDDEEAESSFRIMLHAISPTLLEEHAATSVWLIEGYEPTPASAGVIANVEAGARAYPMQPTTSLLHTALGDNLAEFLQGQESAKQALRDAADAYRDAARERGFLR